MSRYLFATRRALRATPAALGSAALMIMLSGAWNWAGATTPQDEPRVRTVSYQDLDVTRAAGVAALYARIKVAAQDVCEPANARALGSVQLARHCMDDAIANAVARVNSPRLTDYNRAKSVRIRVVTLTRDQPARE